MAARLLARRAYFTRELAMRLEAMGYRAETAARTIERCRELGWVDDDRLARDRAATLRSRGAGSVKIAADLDARGAPPGVIDDAVAASLAERDEAAWAREALVRSRIDPAREPAQAWRLLASRGFPEDVLADVVGGSE